MSIDRINLSVRIEKEEYFSVFCANAIFCTVCRVPFMFRFFFDKNESKFFIKTMCKADARLCAIPVTFVSVNAEEKQNRSQ